MTFRIAVVQPICHRPGTDEANVAEAVHAIERAAGEGAHFVCFPETYPGPWRMPATFDPTAALVLPPDQVSRSLPSRAAAP